ncbi:hypothetical protein KUCAC02_034785 [Chaenocephalus aceratus]|nr:hypothetical protein KUCAC02_034785 [Chaenocephalus aceratus]
MSRISSACLENSTCEGAQTEGLLSLPAMPTLTPSPLPPVYPPPFPCLPSSLHPCMGPQSWLPSLSPPLPPHPGEGPALPYIQRAQQAERNPRVYKLCQASRRRCDPHREGK